MQMTFDDLRKVSFYDPAFSTLAKQVECMNILTEGQKAWIAQVSKVPSLKSMYENLERLQESVEKVDFPSLFSVSRVLGNLCTSLRESDSCDLKAVLLQCNADTDFWRAYYRLMLFLRVNHLKLTKAPAVREFIINYERRACELKADSAKTTQTLTAFGVFSDTGFVDVRAEVLDRFLCGIREKPDSLAEYSKQLKQGYQELEDWYKQLWTTVSLQDVVEAFYRDSENIRLIPDSFRKSLVTQILGVLSLVAEEQLATLYFSKVVLRGGEQSEIRTFKEVIMNSLIDYKQFEESLLQLQEVKEHARKSD